MSTKLFITRQFSSYLTLIAQSSSCQFYIEISEDLKRTIHFDLPQSPHPKRDLNVIALIIVAQIIQFSKCSHVCMVIYQKQVRKMCKSLPMAIITCLPLLKDNKSIKIVINAYIKIDELSKKSFRAYQHFKIFSP